MSLTPRPPLHANLDYLGGAGGYVEEMFEVLCKGPMFEHFDHNEIEALCQFMHCYAAGRGATILEEGDGGDHMLIILSGNVDVRKVNPEGQVVSIATAGPGTSLGEMSLIDGERRYASCVATEPTDFAVMTRADLNEILVAYPRLANKLLIRIMQILVNRLRDTGNRLLSNYLNPIQ